MAWSCTTPEWASGAPNVKLTVTQTSSTNTDATFSWTLQYIASSAAHTNGIARKWSINIGGKTASGTYNINGVTGTKEIKSGTVTLARGTSAKTVSVSCSFYFNVTWSGVHAGTKSASTSFTLNAKTSYTVKYNANGGSGAPSSQTKWAGTNLTLSSTKPTRTGYQFQGWGTSASDTSIDYAAGATYSSDKAITLYAIWKANTYTITYNANGGSLGSVPTSATKTYGTALAISSNKPTRANYNFLGWSTSNTATEATYPAGGSYTANAAATLYAVWELAYWEPKISGFTVSRCGADGTIDEFDGKNILVSFNWECDQSAGANAVSSITVEWKAKSSSTWESATVTASGTSGSVSNQVFGGDSITVEESCNVRITVADSKGGSSTATKDIAGAAYPLDFLAGGKGVAIGRPATIEGFDVQYQAIIRPNIDVGLEEGSGSLIVGEPTSAHMAFDANEIQAKANGTTPEWLYLNKSGGGLWLGSAGSEIRVQNDAQFFGVDSSGNAKSVLNLQSSGGNTLLGRGNYDIGSGETNIYGNGVNIFTNENYIYGNKPFKQDFISVSAGDNTAVSLSTSNQVIPCSTLIVDDSEFMSAGSNGIVFSKTGHVLIFGSVYCSGLTAKDTVFASFYRYRGGVGTQYAGARIGATISTVSIHVPVTVIGVQSGDIVRIAACNLTAARGSAGANTAVKMTAIYLN